MKSGGERILERMKCGIMERYHRSTDKVITSEMWKRGYKVITDGMWWGYETLQRMEDRRGYYERKVEAKKL